MSTETRSTMSVIINPSEQNQQFATGAQRGTESGRGQASLLPFHGLNLIARLFGGWAEMPVEAIDALAKLYEAGAVKYSARNWEKGIPLDAYVNSAWRHYRKFRLGWTDEPHAVQFAWNALCLLQTHIWISESRIPIELNTFPAVNLYVNFQLIPHAQLHSPDIKTAIDNAFRGLSKYVSGDADGVLEFAAYAIQTLHLSQLAEIEKRKQ